jgi:hypothetical protein
MKMVTFLGLPFSFSSPSSVPCTVPGTQKMLIKGGLDACWGTSTSLPYLLSHWPFTCSQNSILPNPCSLGGPKYFPKSALSWNFSFLKFHLLPPFAFWVLPLCPVWLRVIATDFKVVFRKCSFLLAMTVSSGLLAPTGFALRGFSHCGPISHSQTLDVPLTCVNQGAEFCYFK